MSDFKMNKIRFPLGLTTDPTWGAYSGPLEPPAVFKGLAFKGREETVVGKGEGRWELGEGGECERKRKQGAPWTFEVASPPLYECLSSLLVILTALVRAGLSHGLIDVYDYAEKSNGSVVVAVKQQDTPVSVNKQQKAVVVEKDSPVKSEYSDIVLWRVSIVTLYCWSACVTIICLLIISLQQ